MDCIKPQCKSAETMRVEGDPYRYSPGGNAFIDAHLGAWAQEQHLIVLAMHRAAGGQLQHRITPQLMHQLLLHLAARKIIMSL